MAPVCRPLPEDGTGGGLASVEELERRVATLRRRAADAGRVAIPVTCPKRRPAARAGRGDGRGPASSAGWPGCWSTTRPRRLTPQPWSGRHLHPAASRSGVEPSAAPALLPWHLGPATGVSGLVASTVSWVRGRYGGGSSPSQ